MAESPVEILLTHYRWFQDFVKSFCTRYYGWVFNQEQIRGGVPKRLKQGAHGSESLRNQDQTAE